MKGEFNYATLAIIKHKLKQCTCGEIGRHAGFKLRFWKQSMGSTPIRCIIVTSKSRQIYAPVMEMEYMLALEARL